MKIVVLLFVFALHNILWSGQVIQYNNKTDFQDLKITGGSIQFVKRTGLGVGFQYKKELNSQTDLFIDFNTKKIMEDVNGNYQIKHFISSFDPDLKFKDSMVGLFSKPNDKIIVGVNKKHFIGAGKNLNSFFFDFYLYLLGSNNKISLVKKGVQKDDQFYGINCYLENKKIIIDFKNFFSDSKKEDFSFRLKSDQILELKKWNHFGFTFNHVTGKMTLYVNGNITAEKYACTDSKNHSGQEILKAGFKNFDGSDLVLFDGFTGYIENFRLGSTAQIEFKKYINNIFSKVEIESKIIDLQNVNSLIKSISFKIKDNKHGRIKFLYRHGNKREKIVKSEWFESYSIPVNGDQYTLSGFNVPAKYLQWKIVMSRNPEIEVVPFFYNLKIDYERNYPPQAPANIKVSKYMNKIILSWDPNLEFDLKGYVVFWGNRSGKYENNIDVKNKNSYILDFLEIGKNYYFKVKAYDSIDPQNYSSFSREVHYFK